MTYQWFDSPSEVMSHNQIGDWFDTEPWFLECATSETNQHPSPDRRRSSPDSDETRSDLRKKNRKRQWHSKTRTGCHTCKARKVKCDKRRPSCLRCENAHRVCEGYDVPQVQVFDLLKSSTPYSLNLLGEDAEGIQGLQFFREKTTPMLSNFSAHAADFWHCWMPTEAKLHDCMTGQVSNELAQSPARYYGRALRRLSDPADPPSTVIILICCLLFIAMENIKSTNVGIYTHIEAGLRVLREWKAGRRDRGNQNSSDLIINHLEPFLARLEAAAVMTGAIPITPQDEATALYWKRYVVPTSFSSFIEARESWYELCQWLFRQTRSFDNFFNKKLPEFHDMVVLWRRWRCVLEVYKLSSAGKRSIEEDWQLQLLDIQYQTHLIFIELQAESDEVAWDQQLDSYRRIMNVCARFLDYQAEATRTGAVGGFSFGGSVEAPLYSIATVCRDSEVRHQCLELLKKHHHNWHEDDCSAAALAEAVIFLEEDGVGKVNYHCEDVPENRRVRPLAAEFPQPGTIILIYSQTPYNKPESFVFNYKSNDPPVVPAMTLYPSSETVQLAGYQGLIRKATYGCACKAYAGAESRYESEQWWLYDITSFGIDSVQ